MDARSLVEVVCVMYRLGWELLAAFGLLLVLLAFVRLQRYYEMREQDDSDEEKDYEH